MVFNLLSTGPPSRAFTMSLLYKEIQTSEPEIKIKKTSTLHYKSQNLRKFCFKKRFYIILTLSSRNVLIGVLKEVILSSSCNIINRRGGFVFSILHQSHVSIKVS